MEREREIYILLFCVRRFVLPLLYMCVDSILLYWSDGWRSRGPNDATHPKGPNETRTTQTTKERGVRESERSDTRRVESAYRWVYVLLCFASGLGIEAAALRGISANPMLNAIRPILTHTLPVMRTCLVVPCVLLCVSLSLSLLVQLFLFPRCWFVSLSYSFGLFPFRQFSWRTRRHKRERQEIQREKDIHIITHRICMYTLVIM